MNTQHSHSAGHSTSAVGSVRRDHDWALFFKFLTISSVATFASIGNIFTISAIIIDDLLRKKGNSFLVSVTLADLLVTTFMLPASSVAILSQMESSENVCRFQYAIGAMSCITAAVFTAVVGIENCLRLSTLREIEKTRRLRQQQQQQEQHRQQQLRRASLPSSTPTPSTTPRITVQLVPERLPKPRRCSQFQVTVINLSLWMFSASLALLHVLLMPQPMYAACGFFDENGLDRQSLLHSLIIFTTCFTLFILIGGIGFLKCVWIMRSWDRPKRFEISREFALVTSNCWTWLARFLIWCPSLLIAIVSSNPSGDRTGHSSKILPSELISLQGLLLWPAILPPCLSSLINAVSNRDFRRCYIQLFHYCCCKTSVALTRRSRDNLRGGSDVRVHIIPGYNIYNSSTTGHYSEVAAQPPRFNSFKYGSLMACRRDVYEL